jgi:hypothetical protein
MPRSANTSLPHELNQRPDTKVANKGQAYFRFPFINQAVSDGNTFDTGLRVTGVGWTPVDSGDLVRPTVANGTGTQTVAFSTSGGPHTGYLHVWGEPGQDAAPSAGTITADSQREGVAAGGPMDADSRHQGLSEVRMEFASVTDGETFDTGLQSIVEASANHGDANIFTVTESGGVLTFHVPGTSPAACAVHFWHRGY